MLSRVADSLYWMSRYLERAEHTARLLDLNLHQIEQTTAPAERRWARLLASLRQDAAEGLGDATGLAYGLTFGASNDSIVSCISAARENARQVREQISSEMWEQVNRLYLHVRRPDVAAIWHAEPHEFFKAVKEGIHLFQGITDSTMSHDEGWQFIQIGRFLERAGALAALLDVHFSALDEAGAQRDEALAYLDWVALLKSCTAFEAYCKVYTAGIQPERIAEFMLLNAEFPHSLRFAADAVQTALHAVGRATGARGAARVERLSGRLRATLDYGQVDEIMPDMHAYLDQIQRQCAQIHSAIYHTYVAYPVDSALLSER